MKKLLGVALMIVMVGMPSSLTFAAKKPSVPFISGSVTTKGLYDTSVTTTSVTFPHTVPKGRNQVLIVTMITDGSPDDVAATYAGIPLVHGNASGLGDYTYYGYWYLVNPPSGVHDVKVDFGPSGGRAYAALTVGGVDTLHPFDTDAHISGSGPIVSGSLTTTIPNELILYFVSFSAGRAVYTPNDPMLYSVTPDYSNIGALRIQSSAGTVNIGGVVVQNGENDIWELVGIPIRPAR